MEPTYALNTDTLDYTVDELDDIADRKVGPIPVSGDALARLIRARRGTARDIGQADPYPLLREDRAMAAIWGPDALPRPYLGGNRRMAAVGTSNRNGALVSTDKHGHYYTEH